MNIGMSIKRCGYYTYENETLIQVRQYYANGDESPLGRLGSVNAATGTTPLGSIDDRDGTDERIREKFYSTILSSSSRRFP